MLYRLRLVVDTEWGDDVIRGGWGEFDLGEWSDPTDMATFVDFVRAVAAGTDDREEAAIR